MGSKTLNNFFYKLAYGAKGIVEHKKYVDNLDVADAQIEANRVKSHTQGTDQKLDDGGANEVTVANVKDAVTKKHAQNGDTDLDATFEALFVKKADTVNVLSDITSSGANIEDAVTKKHTQGTDQGLDTGGANAVVVADVKDAVTKKHAKNADTDLDPTFEATFAKKTDVDLSGVIYNVKNYGALGDGTTDDTTAITNTIAGLLTNGGTIFFPPGIYKITSSITMNKRGKLLGCTGLEISSATAPVTILKTGNFTGIIITANSVIVDGIVCKGDTGNGGDGIQIKAGRTVLQNVSSTLHGGVGIRIGDDAEEVNCNLWRLINVAALGNTSHGVLIDDVAEINANAGITNGLSCMTNGGDGLKVDRAILNNFNGVCSEGNTGVGIRIGANAKYNSFWNPNSENNTAGNFLFDAGSANNFVAGSLAAGFIPVDSGTNVVIRSDGNSFRVNMINSLTGVTAALAQNATQKIITAVGVDEIREVWAKGNSESTNWRLKGTVFGQSTTVLNIYKAESVGIDLISVEDDVYVKNLSASSKYIWWSVLRVR